MTDVSADFAERPDFAVPWLERWVGTDFSWPGLADRPPWLRGQGGSLQDYLRRVEREASDEDLTAQGILLNCGPRGWYHFLFVPPEWLPLEDASITPDELLQLKQRYWEKLFSDGGIRDASNGTIAGADLPPNIGERLVSGFRVSFEWVRFNTSLRNIPRRGDRTFTSCLFNEELNFFGRASSEGEASSVQFTWCEFEKQINLQEVSGLNLLDFNGSAMRGKLDVSDSDLLTFRMDYCAGSSLSLTDSNVRGQLTIGGSELKWIEWINCTFDAHVLFVDSEITESVGLLACDFKSRLTLAEMRWPKSPYNCASASGSKFDGIVEIAGGEMPPIQLFQEAEFRSKVSLSSFSDQLKRQSFKSELEAAASSSEKGFDKQKHAQHVESGCRTLRKVAEAAGDVHSEQLWHRTELIARRARGESAFSEKAFSELYGLLADYGLSISRPFLTLLVSTAFFALFYAWLGGVAWVGSIDWRSLEEGFGYSLNRTFPIGVFADEGNIWRTHLLGSGGRSFHIAVRAIATTQSIVSAVLIYLGVMAIRRKFRIS